MNRDRMEELLSHLGNVKIAVIGDYFLDRYYYIDVSKVRHSTATGNRAYQVVQKTASPGAAGTVAKALAALGVGEIYAAGFTGDDGEGDELRRQLKKRGINSEYLFISESQVTPTYTMILSNESGEYRETGQMDIKNQKATPEDIEEKMIETVHRVVQEAKPDAIIILDQLNEENFGATTGKVRDELSKIALDNPDLIMFVDSRQFIHEFHNMYLKCNGKEFEKSEFYCKEDTIEDCAGKISRENGRPIIITKGKDGVMIVNEKQAVNVPTFTVSGKIDVRGAGDAFSAGFVSALCCGADLEEAGCIGNLTSSVCIRKIGTTGEASQTELLECAFDNLWRSEK